MASTLFSSCLMLLMPINAVVTAWCRSIQTKASCANDCPRDSAMAFKSLIFCNSSSVRSPFGENHLGRRCANFRGFHASIYWSIDLALMAKMGCYPHLLAESHQKSLTLRLTMKHVVFWLMDNDRNSPRL